MSRTLFWYIFKDMLRIFFLTSGALAGIMSFGGLLRPLTQHGLDASQVGRILTYFLPAMSTYSLPIAALFATTMVYGRLSADNELTAMRASGISYLSITSPAMVLGLTVSLVSLLFLCFVVPVFTLKVEKVVWSNLAKIVASEIDRTHEVKFEKDSVHALAAIVQKPDPANPQRQCVVLIAPTIITYEKNSSDREARIPAEFFMARKTTVYIDQADETAEPQVTIIPEGGTKFPRKFAGAMRGGLEFTQYGPITMPAPIKENSKFMVLSKLQELYQDPAQSRGVREAVADIISRQEQRAILSQMLEQLQQHGTLKFDAEAGEVYTLDRGDSDVELDSDGNKLALTAKSSAAHLPRLIAMRGGAQALYAEAAQIRLSLTPDDTTAHMSVLAELENALVGTGSDATPRSMFRRPFDAATPADVLKFKDYTARELLADPTLPQKDVLRIKRELTKSSNQVLAELNSRASFAVACLILVLVGCCLGILFKSGNFLTAFAVSVVPALMSVLLIVTGQHVCESVPAFISANYHNPLNMGLSLIWTGNMIVLVIAVVLMTKLQRQ